MNSWPAMPADPANAAMVPPMRTAQQEPPQPNQTQLPPPPTGQNIAPAGAFPGSLTPGWNDPPPVPADSVLSNSNSRRPRLDLRKRVAYPMDGLGNSTMAVKPLPMPNFDVASSSAAAAASPSRPVAKVTPRRKNPQMDSTNSSLSSNNGNETNAPPSRLPPLAPGSGDLKLKVAKVSPRQK